MAGGACVPSGDADSEPSVGSTAAEGRGSAAVERIGAVSVVGICSAAQASSAGQESDSGRGWVLVRSPCVKRLVPRLVERSSPTVILLVMCHP